MPYNCKLFGLVSLFNGISAFMGYVMPKPYFYKNSNGTIQPIDCDGDKRVHTFPKNISPNVSVMVRLEFELAYNNVTVQHVSHYATGTHTCKLFLLITVTLIYDCLLKTIIISYLKLYTCVQTNDQLVTT